MDTHGCTEVCLVAHNGDGTDFDWLCHMLSRHGMKMPLFIKCAWDTLKHAKKHPTFTIPAEPKAATAATATATATATAAATATATATATADADADTANAIPAASSESATTATTTTTTVPAQSHVSDPDVDTDYNAAIDQKTGATHHWHKTTKQVQWSKPMKRVPLSVGSRVELIVCPSDQGARGRFATASAPKQQDGHWCGSIVTRPPTPCTNPC